MGQGGQDLHFMAFKESEVRRLSEAEFPKSMWMYLGMFMRLSLRAFSVRK